VDAETERHVLKLITGFCDSGGCAILVTHSDAVAQAAGRVVRLADGRVVNDG
jgi:ABC-type lipoprotein export system ATPase subunit